MKFDGTGAFFRSRFFGFVFDIQNLAPQERTLLIDFEKFESLTALRHDVHASIVIGLGDGEDLRRTTYVCQGVLLCADDAEKILLVQALADHFLVTGFEDVQGEWSAGKQHNIQGKQWEKRTQSTSEGIREQARFTDCTTLA